MQLSLLGKEVAIGTTVTGTSFVIDAVLPSSGCRITRCSRNKLHIVPSFDGKPTAATGTPSTPLALADQLGGMERTKDMLLEVVLLPILLSELFSTMGIAPPRGTLVPPIVSDGAPARCSLERTSRRWKNSCY